MKLLITGVLGFIGGSVAREAARLGHEVVGVGRAPRAPADLPFRYAHAEGERALADLVAQAAPDAILHAAGSASVGASIAAPRDDFERAVVTWATLLEAVRRSGARRMPRVMLPSSAAVYGDPAHLPVPESAPAAPISPYGYHKLVCELLGREYAACFGLDVLALRLFSVFGPAQRRLLVWELFDQLAGPAEVAFLQGTGRETRDYLHADDVAAAVLGLAALPRAEGGRFEAVNVASGEEVAAIEVARLLCDRVAPGKGIECRGAPRPGDPQRWRADVTRLSSLLDPWRPRPFREALASCAAIWAEGRKTA
jgi:UDP-glucose 4-epimerase